MNPRYREWLKHVFDHEVKKPQWHFDLNAPDFIASPIEITELLTQTFLRSGKDLTDYTDAQVGQGISFLASPSCSDFMFALKSSNVPLAKRLEAIGSISYLYSDCFAKRCTETLGHLDEGDSELNSACYMFWDICPITYLEDVPDSEEIRAAILNVLQKTLTIEHRACREGALHGLSEMFYSHQEAAQEIIDRFLSKTKLDDQLLAYARNARDGNVL